MAIIPQRTPGMKVIELGGGANPLVHPHCLGGSDIAVDVRICHNAQGQQTVDFAADFNEPLPITSDEFDAVISQFCLEHVSWRKVGQFLKESCRILKPGGKAVFITANTEAQMQWVLNHNEWDDHSSCILFGDLDYPENSHKNALSPTYAVKLFTEAGYEKVTTQPYGELATDMVIEAWKPKSGTLPVGTIVDNKVLMQSVEVSSLPAEKLAKVKEEFEQVHQGPKAEEKPVEAKPDPLAGVPREQLFDKAYFGGGGKWGGYAREGYRDFPVHEITVRKILAKRPESVLELACARGYVLKRIQDAGVRAEGLEISRHCVMTRACEGVHRWDLCDIPWPILMPVTGEKPIDLVTSTAFLEHVPEQFVPDVISMMSIIAERGLHGIDFGAADDGWDKTHSTLKPKEWWIEQFNKHAPGWPVEVVDKEWMEQGQFPEDVLKGDGKIKLNVGSFISMYHHGWQNIDIHDLEGFAKANGYNYLRHDVRNGLPYQTGTVSAITACHSLEHLSAKDGLSFLRECRRVLRADGTMRIQVPDAGLLIDKFNAGTLGEFDEINEGCSNSHTQAGKLWELLHSGHAACYDKETLQKALEAAGFVYLESSFRATSIHTPWGGILPDVQFEGFKQIQREATDTLPGLTLFADAIPNVV